MKRAVLVAIAFCVLGCNKNEVNPPVDNTVHLAGYVGMPDGAAFASYWKDGVYTALGDGSIGTQVNSLYVDGTSVWVGGYRIPTAPPSRAVYWQDGIETRIAGGTASMTLIAAHAGKLFGVWHDEKSRWVYLKNGKIQPISDTAWNFGPTSLALKGEDMYVSGAALSFDNKYQYAQYWKNGIPAFRENISSQAMSVYVHGDDVYLGGYNHPNPTTQVACYWKNGRRVDLTDLKKGMAAAWSVFVTDEHLYASGTLDGRAVYWKDGEVTYLTDGQEFAMANCIFVREPDVHVGGYENNFPRYWKNNEKQKIDKDDTRGMIKYIVVGSN